MKEVNTFFNSVNAKSIIKKVFGETCYCYPGSGYNMCIANIYGMFNYTEEYVKTGKLTEYDGKVILSDFDEDLVPEVRVIKITSEQELKEYLIKVNNWMSDQFQRCLPGFTSDMADSILKVLD